MKMDTMELSKKRLFYKSIKNWICYLVIILFSTSLHSSENKTQLTHELEECLQVYWGVDRHTSDYIRNKLRPLLDNTDHHPTIKEFIALSKKQNIDFSINKKISPLPDEDGIYKSPKEHLVVFENPYRRILWGSTEPGAREPFHVHAWKSIMLIIKPTTFEIEYPNGAKETTFYPIGVFELPANERYACTNVGKTADESLRFEIKE